jgi:hypothetical protein
MHNTEESLVSYHYSERSCPNRIKLISWTASMKNWNVCVLKYHMKNVMGDYSSEVGKEDFFNPTTGNENLHKVSIYNGTGVITLSVQNCLCLKYIVTTL